MPYVVLHNLCNCLEGTEYPLFGLRSLIQMVKKDTNEDDTKLQLMLLTHITKIRWTVYESAAYIKNFCSLTRVLNETRSSEEAEWMQIGQKMLTNVSVSWDSRPSLKQLEVSIYVENFPEFTSRVCF